MNLVYFKSSIGNFGDDLNSWMWEDLLGDFSLYSNELDFVGIGSVLDERLDKTRKQVVFGSGVRDFVNNIEDHNLDVKFVRGPISAKSLGGVPYITDAAYCLSFLPEGKVNDEKKYKCSIIPYFRHMNSLDWNSFERLTGIHVIDVRKDTKYTITEISKSEKVICGAMHGAIIADILRVPWVRLRFGRHGFESTLTSELKWHDWLYSISLDKQLEYIDLADSIYTGKKRLLNKTAIFYQFIETLIRVKKNKSFYLSTDNRFFQIKEELYIQLETMKKNRMII